MSEDGVFTLDPRITFVEGEVTTGTPGAGLVACGDGTFHPLQVTPDQLAELFYRVRDAEFSSNLREVAPSGGPATIDFLISGGAPPLAHHAPTSSNPYVARSYAKSDSPTPANLDGEREMWTENLISPDPDLAGVDRLIPYPDEYPDHGIVNGLCLYSKWELDGGVSAPTDYCAYGLYDEGLAFELLAFNAQLELSFNGEVAWVDTSGSGNPLDTNNELWVGMVLSGGCSDEFFDYPLLFHSASYVFTGDSGDESTIPDGFTIVLSDSSVSCSLWGGFDYTYTGGITLTATEWWPYQDGGGDVWNTATGIKIP
jgi:hypothetical protein